ncbi:hypothetical protein FNF28_06931 [Cafeteria roenbergensis]|uniref:Uncharacterized protein n=1 Tax=Cafeteria roenbergensis TaxID=33653 RepID=A0A5A8CLF2_CAFRO|nr:hypothetical protein FNF28_06931 [Cafeteria roenbergensis]
MAEAAAVPAAAQHLEASGAVSDGAAAATEHAEADDVEQEEDAEEAAAASGAESGDEAGDESDQSMVDEAEAGECECEQDWQEEDDVVSSPAAADRKGEAGAVATPAAVEAPVPGSRRKGLAQLSANVASPFAGSAVKRATQRPAMLESPAVGASRSARQSLAQPILDLSGGGEDNTGECAQQ